MKTKDTVLKEHIDEKFSSIEELLRMILVSNVTMELSLSSDISNIGGQTIQNNIVQFDESKKALSAECIDYISINNLVYHGRLCIFGNDYHIIEISEDIVPSIIKKIYNNLKKIVGNNIVLVFENLIESRKRNLKKNNIPFMIKR